MIEIEQFDTTTASERAEWEDAEAIRYAKNVKDFASGVISYVILAIVFFTIEGVHEPILYWVFGGIGLGLILQGLMAFLVIRFPVQTFEQMIVEKRLGRKLD